MLTGLCFCIEIREQFTLYIKFCLTWGKSENSVVTQIQFGDIDTNSHVCMINYNNIEKVTTGVKFDDNLLPEDSAAIF